MKKLSISIFFLTFAVFCFYEISEKSSFNVLEVASPTEITIDLNQNGIRDDGETISLTEIESFSTKPDGFQAELAKKLKISGEEAISLGFLAENFAKEKLAEKKVKIEDGCSESKTKKVLKKIFKPSRTRVFCKPKILVNNQSYENLILYSGLAVDKNFKRTEALEKNLKKAHALNLRIFNEKSHKYHTLNCKYGLKAHTSEIIPANQLPIDSKPCNFCLTHNKKHLKSDEANDDIPNIISAPNKFSTDLVKIFLTDLTRVLKPSNNCETTLCATLIQEIDSAQNSIDFAIYGYTKIPKLQKALEKAQNRGVEIRFAYDIDTKNKNLYPDTLYLTKILKKNNADYSTISKNQNAIMHNKFFIFDRKKVLTGSANISNTDLSGFNSNAVILINSPEIANIYEQEFEQMYLGKFHTEKNSILGKEHIVLDNVDFSVYFSPKDKIISQKLIPLIDGAKNYIYMPVFLITHQGLAKSLVSAHQRGVFVKVIVDATNANGNYSAHKLLRQNGIEVKTENFAGKMHSKSIIIDDIYTIIGSMNFSKSGEKINDENLIVIKNKEIALFYKTFFQYLWKRIPDKWLKYNAKSESFDSIGSCNDGIDNDFDEKIDMADDSCKIKPNQN